MSKILFYMPFMKIGGLEKVGIEYLNMLKGEGYDIELIVDFNLGKEDNTFESFIPEGIPFEYIKSESVSKKIFEFRMRGKEKKIYNIFLYASILVADKYYYHTKLKKFFEEKEFDYIVGFTHFPPSYLTKYKKSHHIVWIHNSIEHYMSGMKNLFKGTYEKKLKAYDTVVTIANEMREQIKDYYPNFPSEKLTMIYNPFNFEEIEHRADEIEALSEEEKHLLDERYICTVTRLDEGQKDTVTLIEAYTELYGNGKIEEKLYIIGDGPSETMLKELVKSKKLEHQILFLGRKTNPFIWVKNAEIFILSSKFEGLPTVLMEAMILKTFVIASKCKTGPREILQNGEAGALFEVGNSSELALEIEKALTNKAYREAKIIKATQRVEAFSRENVLVKLNELFGGVKR